ncbi:SLC13 family permease [Leucobacter sp. G161]|uniref:SLC13 family permease n=1 Tax=Leucobacter sp. G161 TaxID=663704 RepID=UPI00073B9B69|nr:SLC13 family permease [Leucobacter sp. G161]KUF08333.1 transporter [Leucobacter sp. G161]
MSTVRYATVPPPGRATLPREAGASPQPPRRGDDDPSPRRAPRRVTKRWIAAAVVLLLAAWLIVPAAIRTAGGAIDPAALSLPAATTLAVFLAAVWGWVFTTLDDTLVALLAAAGLIILGALPADTFFASLGDDTIWLLICACIIAAGVAASGLALRGAAQLVTRARRPRTLAHASTAALIVSAFAIPATSGRAALALPVYRALATALPGRPALLRALGLIFPTVILLSAVGSLLGAGAHLITSQILTEATGEGIGFLRWLVLGLPLAVVSSHLACELVLLRFTSRAERRTRVSVALTDLAEQASTPVSGPLTRVERRALLLLAAVIALWCTEPLHGLSPAIVALLGAIAMTLPKLGCIGLGPAVKRVPWNLLLFLAATLALGSALTRTGAAAWLGESMLGPVRGLGQGAGLGFLLLVVALSLAAHLVIQSRSARSAALIPIIVAIAPGIGVDPAAAAFASTAAAGFCHTLPSSAKPVAMFTEADAGAGIDPADLRTLSAWLAPLLFTLIIACSLWLWPILGLPLFI